MFFFFPCYASVREWSDGADHNTWQLRQAHSHDIISMIVSADPSKNDTPRFNDTRDTKATCRFSNVPFVTRADDQLSFRRSCRAIKNENSKCWQLSSQHSFIHSTSTITFPTVTEQRCLQTTPIVYRPPSTVYRHNAIHRVLQTPFHGGARAPLGGHNVHSQAWPHFGGTPSLLPAIHGQRPQRRIGMSMLSGLQRWTRALFVGGIGIPRTPHDPGLCQAT